MMHHAKKEQRTAMQEVKPSLLKKMSADPWFGAMSANEQSTVLSASRMHAVGAGMFVFRQGDAPNGFFGLVEGLLKVSTLSEEGKEAVLTVFDSNSWFGEASVIDALPRVHDVSAQVDSMLLVIKPASFEALMQSAFFARSIALLQTRHTRLVYARLEDATLRSTQLRLVRQLLRLAKAGKAKGAKPTIPLTQTLLATMLGVTRQTLGQELKQLERRGLIQLAYGQVVIESLEHLAQFEDALRHPDQAAAPARALRFT